MKKFPLMAAASIVALLAASPVIAESYSAGSGTEAITTPAPAAPEKADSSSMSSPPERASTAASDVVKASLLPQDPGMRPAAISVDKRMTAEGMIGKPVYNQQNERVATVEDVILDSEGHANMIVVKDSSFMGLGGKLAAFDYDSVIDRKKDGDLVMPITQKTIDNVAEFSYEPSDKPTIKAIPDHGYSVKKILSGDLVDPSGKKVAAIDNVTLRDGRANLVIAAYNQILGLGGDKVAIDFDATELVQDKDNLNLKLSDAQARKFETFKAENK
ncbi:MAG: PRC-barrel domain-containing protein [Alphaproteobacteria bacterium]